jgi:tetratricopeptide (TPR) repeat protein
MYTHSGSNKNTQIVFLYLSNSKNQEIYKDLKAQVNGLNPLGVLINWCELPSDQTFNDNCDILNTADADIVVLLVIPQFIELIQKTPPLYNQIQAILKRRQNEDIIVVPLIIRQSFGWERYLPNLSPLPKEGAVVGSRQNINDVLYAIAEDLEKIINNHQKYQQKLQEYKNIFLKTIQNEYPFSTGTINYLNDFKSDSGLKHKDIVLIEEELTIKAEVKHNEKISKYKLLFWKKILWQSNINEQDRTYLRTIQLDLGLQNEEIAIIEQQFIQQNIVQRIYQIIYTQQPLSPILLAFIILIVIFSIFSDVQPIDKDKLLKQADNKLEIGNYKEAIKTYTEVIKIDPLNSKAYIGRGEALVFMNNYKAAIQDYTQAINNYPELVLPYMNRAVVSCALGNKKGAIRDYQKAANLYEKQGLIEDRNGAIKRLQQIQQNQCPLRAK